MNSSNLSLILSPAAWLGGGPSASGQRSTHTHVAFDLSRFELTQVLPHNPAHCGNGTVLNFPGPFVPNAGHISGQCPDLHPFLFIPVKANATANLGVGKTAWRALSQ